MRKTPIARDAARSGWARGWRHVRGRYCRLRAKFRHERGGWAPLLAKTRSSKKLKERSRANLRIPRSGFLEIQGEGLKLLRSGRDLACGLKTPFRTERHPPPTGLRRTSRAVACFAYWPITGLKSVVIQIGNPTLPATFVSSHTSAEGSRGLSCRCRRLGRRRCRRLGRCRCRRRCRRLCRWRSHRWGRGSHRCRRRSHYGRRLDGRRRRRGRGGRLRCGRAWCLCLHRLHCLLLLLLRLALPLLAHDAHRRRRGPRGHDLHLPGRGGPLLKALPLLLALGEESLLLELHLGRSSLLRHGWCGWWYGMI